MSLSEILTAVKALPQTEKIQLIHVLVDEVSTAVELAPEAAAMSKLFPPGAVLHTGWRVTTDEAGMRVLQETLSNPR